MVSTMKPAGMDPGTIGKVQIVALAPLEAISGFVSFIRFAWKSLTLPTVTQTSLLETLVATQPMGKVVSEGRQTAGFGPVSVAPSFLRPTYE
jgi:hypothetical protein